ncbi:hypothetical protein [Streptomyces sp. NPDC000410]|uniref:hypothetical protein n=1 Tax=Streptomyces sp. NPDC000410 TaxID=3154254 RepID=UPI003327D535
MEGHGQHVLVGDTRAADGLAALAGGLLAFEGAVADVLAFHAGHRRQHGEHDAGGIVRALQLPSDLTIPPFIRDGIHRYLAARPS